MSAIIKLQRGKGYRVEAGHPWVYNNEVELVDQDIVDGDLVEVYNFKNNFIGKGFYNSKSQILIRLLTRDAAETIDESFFIRKITASNILREQLGYTNNYRVVFGEADGLPSLVVDKFNDVLVVQILTLGMEQWKQEIIHALTKIFAPSGIYERNDVPVRILEGLKEQKGFLTPPFETKFVIEEPGGVKFGIDIENGQKTGFFLDQKENRLCLKPYVENREVLDCFCYTGSFSLYAAMFKAKHVLGLDISEEAIKQAEANAKLNQFSNCTFEVQNTFDALTNYHRQQRKFDTIILDPPAFTKSRHNIDNALKGYKEINLKALKLLNKGGYLITCTCSHFITEEHFVNVLFEAANDAQIQIRQLEYRIQSHDHPYIWGIDETLYLKFYVLQVV
ncbi:MAG: class I SAM-dependent rRNA methyltransferase [Bacteroidetes bacterium]|nr:class I SAM-dependent rRNA methyltransferase [Bacteroidota bacterium]